MSYNYCVWQFYDVDRVRERTANAFKFEQCPLETNNKTSVLN